MDPTSCFFAKLRKVAVNLETQTAELQKDYDTRNEHDDHEKTERARRACYELSSEVKEFKSQVQTDLQQQRQRMMEVDRFLDACMVMKRKVGEDMDTIVKHCEKYGYRAPQKASDQNSGATNKGTEKENEEAGQGAADAQNVGEDPSSPEPHPATSTADLKRTPQFSDFGLSEANLRRMAEAVDHSVDMELGGTDRGGAAAAACSLGYLRTPQFSDYGLSEVDLRKRLLGPDVTAPLPYSPPSLYMTSATPKTPKCTLRMDDELHTPQAPYFGVSEHSMCLNNDFTMDLQRKGVELQAAQRSTVSDLHHGTDGSATPDGMFPSPNRSKRVYGRTSSPTLEETPFLKKQPQSSMPLKSPEVPQFESAYLNRALGRKMGEKHMGATSVPADGPLKLDLTTPANNGTNPGQERYEYNVPEMILDDVLHTPETPVLNMDLWHGLQPAGSRAVGTGHTEPLEPSVPSLKLDDPMMSPKMPDLSSETLTNFQHLLERSKTAVVLPNHRPSGKENRTKVISEVTQVEFQRLPSYLRQMPLSSLNQALQKLNQAAVDSQHDESEEFTMSDLKRMAGLDSAVSKAPVYFLCLTELNRLRQVRGMGMNSEYRLVLK